MPQSVLTIAGLSYTYSDGTEALRQVDLTLHSGERVGLIGPNGSGKSTLLLCLAGLLKGTGRVLTHTPVGAAAADAGSRGQIGLVFQSPDDQLFMPTVRDDLAFGPINQGLTATLAAQRVQKVAEQMGLIDLLERAPYHLSMGQKRSAAIACVLAMEPSVLLLDEPSSNLDPRGRRQLMRILEPLPATLLIASHDLALVGSICSRVLLIDGGRILADGPAALLSDAVLMEAHGLEAWNAPTGLASPPQS